MDKKTLSKNKKLKNVVVEPVEIHNVEPDVVHEIKPVLEQSDVEPVEIQAFGKKIHLSTVKFYFKKGKACLPRRFFLFI